VYAHNHTIIVSCKLSFRLYKSFTTCADSHRFSQALVKSKHVNSYARGYASKLKEQQLKVGMSLMVEVEKVLQVRCDGGAAVSCF